MRKTTGVKALHLLEELVSVGQTTTDTKEARHDIIATTLREKIHVPREQFEAYFLALMTDKELISRLDILHHTFAHRPEAI